MTTAAKIRVSVLLACLLGALGWYRAALRAEAWRPDWRHPERVSVVLLTPRTASESERAALAAIGDFAVMGTGKPTFWALRDWFDQELARYVPEKRGSTAVSLQVLGPYAVDGPPPAPPRAGESGAFLERWQRSRAFLGWFQARRREHPEIAPIAVFVYTYPESERSLFAEIHSVAERRSRSGFVFTPLSAAGVEQALTHTAHETLHLFGATDKYVGERCAFPQGYADPWKEPRHPQAHAEVMAMGFPTDGQKEQSLRVFEEMRVGVETAFEIGWVTQERRDRYYAGDRSAGPAE